LKVEDVLTLGPRWDLLPNIRADHSFSFMPHTHDACLIRRDAGRLVKLPNTTTRSGRYDAANRTLAQRNVDYILRLVRRDGLGGSTMWVITHMPYTYLALDITRELYPNALEDVLAIVAKLITGQPLDGNGPRVPDRRYSLLREEQPEQVGTQVYTHLPMYEYVRHTEGVE
jgi:hypothetical protein